MRRTFFFLIAVGFLGLFAASAVFASGQSEGSASAAQPAGAASGSPSVSFWWYNMTNKEVYEALAAKFQKQTGIPVELQGYAGWGQMHEKEMLVVASGNPPDVAIEKPMNMPDLASRGALMVLDPFLEKAGLKSDTWFNVQISYDAKWNGKTYTMPFWMASQAFFINTDLFKKAGLDPNNPPKTWNQVIEDAKKMTDSNAGVFGFMIPGANDPNPFLMLAVQNGAEIVSPTRTPQVKVDSPEAIEALQLEYDLFFKYDISPPPSSAVLQLAYNDKAAMFVSHNNTVADLAKFAPNVNYMTVPMPAGKVNNKVIEMSASLDMFAKAQHPNEGFEWMKFLSTNRENQIQFANASGLFPSMPQAAADQQFSNPRYRGFQIIAQEQNYTPRPVVVGAPQIYRTIGDAVQAVLTNQKSPKEALTAAQREIDDVLKQQ